MGRETRAAAAALAFHWPEQENIVGALGPKDSFVDRIGDVTVFQAKAGGTLYFTAGLAIDADGAYLAYKAGNKGLDYDRNARRADGKWVGVVTNAGGKPVVLHAGDPAPGYSVSTTSQQDPTRARTDPLRYVDSEQVPYLVLPGGALGPARLGDYGLIVNTLNRKTVYAIAADSGPKHKIGEASMAAARVLLGDKQKYWSPRKGGSDEKVFLYVIFPGSRDGRFPASHPAMPERLLASLIHINARATLHLAASGFDWVPGLALAT